MELTKNQIIKNALKEHTVFKTKSSHKLTGLGIEVVGVMNTMLTSSEAVVIADGYPKGTLGGYIQDIFKVEQKSRNKLLKQFVSLNRETIDNMFSVEKCRVSKVCGYTIYTSKQLPNNFVAEVLDIMINFVPNPRLLPLLCADSWFDVFLETASMLGISVAKFMTGWGVNIVDTSEFIALTSKLIRYVDDEMFLLEDKGFSKTTTQLFKQMYL